LLDDVLALLESANIAIKRKLIERKLSLDNDPTPSFEQRPTIANRTGLANSYF
jgi:hypothetical protein